MKPIQRTMVEAKLPPSVFAVRAFVEAGGGLGLGSGPLPAKTFVAGTASNVSATQVVRQIFRLKKEFLLGRDK